MELPQNFSPSAVLAKAFNALETFFALPRELKDEFAAVRGNGFAVQPLDSTESFHVTSWCVARRVARSCACVALLTQPPRPAGAARSTSGLTERWAPPSSRTSRTPSACWRS
eukprot:scaffold808_cov370-Prasinococcus_capsulatus_cf.AAC.28